MTSWTYRCIEIFA